MADVAQARVILEGLLLDLEAGASHGRGGQQVSRPPALCQVSPGARMHIERAIRLAIRALTAPPTPGLGGDRSTTDPSPPRDLLALRALFRSHGLWVELAHRTPGMLELRFNRADPDNRPL